MIKNIDKNELKNIFIQVDNSFNLIYKNAFLFYGHIKKDKTNILEYYEYNLEKKQIHLYKVYINKPILFNQYYLTFKKNQNKFFNKKIKWKLITYKTIWNRLKKSFYLYNNFKFNACILVHTISNVKNINILYDNHLKEIKKQFICFNLSQKYKISYKWCIINFEELKKKLIFKIVL